MLFATATLISLAVVAQPEADEKEKPEDPEEAAKLEQARTYFDAGGQAYRAGDYANAAGAFEKAYALLPNPAITFSIAQSYRLQYFVDQDSKYLRLAIDAYKRYLREVAKGGRRDDAIEHLAALEERLAKVEEAAGEVVVVPEREDPTRLMVTATPEEAQASIDGSEPATVPVTREVELGKHDVVISADGYFTRRIKVDVLERGGLRIKEVNLEPKPATVEIAAPGGSDIRIDGRLVGRAPLGGPLALKAGKHTVVVTDVGRHPYRVEFDVARGDEHTVAVKLKSTFQRTLSWWFLGAGAASFIGTGAVVGVALASEGKARLLLRKRDVEMQNLTLMERDDYNDARDRRNDLLAASSAGLAAGVLFSAVGGLLYFLDEPDLGDVGIGSGTNGVGALVTPNTVGLSYGGSF